MSELKSAFEIDGFIEGECEIINECDKLTYKVTDSNIYFRNQGNEAWKRNGNKLTYFKRCIFRKHETKKKMYRHEYWLNDGDWCGQPTYRYKMIEIDKPWDEINTRVSLRKLIKTTEIEE